MMEDLLSVNTGKHDYDWLLTPPGTPLLSSSKNTTEHQLSSTAPRSSSNVRSVLPAKASRFSMSQSENGHSTRPVRSSSTTRPSIFSTHSSSYFSNNSRTSVLNTSSASVTSKPSSYLSNNSKTSALNTSSASVTSKPSSSVSSNSSRTSASATSRPSTPGNRSTAKSTTRTPSPASRPATSRPFTPAKTRSTSSFPGEKPKPLQNSRPTTLTTNSQIPTNSNSNSNTLPARLNSRPSTPTRRTPSRPPSPAPKAQAPPQQLALPGSPLDVPPNLRKKLPDRLLSTGKQRSVTASTAPANLKSEAAVPASWNHRQSSSPVVSRGRLLENSPKARVQCSPPEIKKAVVNPASATERTGSGRTNSKKLLDMALRHMDIRQGMGPIRGASLFPPGIRSVALKRQPACSSDPAAPTIDKGVMAENDNGNGTTSKECNGAIAENGNGTAQSSEGESLTV